MGSLLAHVIHIFSITIFSFLSFCGEIIGMDGFFMDETTTFDLFLLIHLLCVCVCFYFLFLFYIYIYIYFFFIYFFEKINKRKVNWGKGGDIICFVGIYLPVMSLYRPKCFVVIYLPFMSLYRPNLFYRYLFTR